MKEQVVNIFWFRRDLRVIDNHGLYQALISDKSVLPVFIFDSDILNDLEHQDSRVSFILGEVHRLQDFFEQQGSSLWIYHGKTLNAFKRLLVEHKVESVYTNLDYEPNARARDLEVLDYLTSEGVNFHTFKDHVVFHMNDILKADGKPYVVFTPYSKKWLSKLTDADLKPFPSEKHMSQLFKMSPLKKYHHSDIGFRHGDFSFPPLFIDQDTLKGYAKKRDFPGLDATSHLGVHLRFGTTSIRKLTALAKKYSSVFLNELIWRNFYIDILWHFPFVVTRSFKPEYDHIQWLNSEKNFERWCGGTTGYPMVDAGMRQLNQTGYMHNRVRMITASFLCKHLLIDWRWGEAYFAEKLLDFELSSNNGGWQWASGSGCDAAPYFRVFNPQLQMEKYDPDLTYVRKWIPEYGTTEYPAPIVPHNMVKARAIEAYQAALKR